MDLYEIMSNGLFVGLDELLPVSATWKHQDQDYLTFSFPEGMESLLIFIFHWHPGNANKYKITLPKGNVSKRNLFPSWFSIQNVFEAVEQMVRWRVFFSHFDPSLRRDLWLNSLQMVLVQTGPGVGWGSWWRQQFPGVRETVLLMGSLSHSMFEKGIRQYGCFRQRYIYYTVKNGMIYMSVCVLLTWISTC